MPKVAAAGTGRSIACGLIAACIAGPTASAGPAMSTNWTDITIQQSECIARAERAVRDAGLNRNFEIVGQSVFGQLDAYTAVVRCVAEKGFVMFAVSGPELDESKRRMRLVFDRF